MTQISNSEKARRIIASNDYLTLATCDLQGKPWAAPLYYAYDSEFNFFFISALDTLHVKHIKQNPNVSCAIFDSHAPVGEGDGVQIEGVAERVGALQLPHALAVYFRRRFPEEIERLRHKHLPTEYLGGSFFWFFVIRPLKVFTLDLTVKDVDKRIEVSVKEP